mmetsp:Transcript_3422/g.9290  ORF Transcript_3422/g.9290 Transcript_3422/m.9290 type:complete len:264 (+) Transcript_3422:720-1511(+)
MLKRSASGELRGRSVCSKCQHATASQKSMAPNFGTCILRSSPRFLGRTSLKPSSTFIFLGVVLWTSCASCACGWTVRSCIKSRARRGSACSRPAARSGTLWTCWSQRSWMISPLAFIAHGCSPMAPRLTPAMPYPSHWRCPGRWRHQDHWGQAQQRNGKQLPPQSGGTQAAPHPGSLLRTALWMMATWPSPRRTRSASGRGRARPSSSTPRALGASSRRCPGTTSSRASARSTDHGGAPWATPPRLRTAWPRRSRCRWRPFER